ncbi:MAG TPA: hypothetical protein ENI71_00795 [Chromatiales bacterium]|nr:hypothetical protein [Chromatiales bacterium]
MKMRKLPTRVIRVLSVAGDDWALGYNLGVLYAPTPRTRFGLSYAHLFVSNSSTNDTDRLGHSLVGTNTSDVNRFGGQVVWSF